MERLSELLDDVAIESNNGPIYDWMVEATNRIQELQARTEKPLPAPETKYRYPDTRTFPTLYEDHKILVYTNSSGEILIETKTKQGGLILTERECQVVGDFLETLSDYMVNLLSKPEAQELAANEVLVRRLKKEREGI